MQGLTVHGRRVEKETTKGMQERNQNDNKKKSSRDVNKICPREALLNTLPCYIMHELE